MHTLSFMLLSFGILFSIDGEKQQFDYTVSLKTGRGLGAGTDSTFNLTFIGFEKNATFLLDGEGAKLEAGGLDIFNFTDVVLIYPINQMVLQRIQRRGLDSKWYLSWLALDVNDTGYTFSVNKWIRDDEPQIFTSVLGDCKDGFVRYQVCRRL